MINDSIRKVYDDFVENDPNKWEFDVDRGDHTPYKINVVNRETNEVWAVCPSEDSATFIRDVMNKRRLINYLGGLAVPELLRQVEELQTKCSDWESLVDFRTKERDHEKAKYDTLVEAMVGSDDLLAKRVVALEDEVGQMHAKALSWKKLAVALQNERWIPVTEAEPELNKRILVYSQSYGRSFEAEYVLWDGMPRFAHRDDYFEGGDVTHWKPMPNGPKQEK